MDVLCTDKTGTLTEGKISLHAYQSLGEKDDQRLLPYSLPLQLGSVGYAIVCNPMTQQSGGDTLRKTKNGQSTLPYTKVDEIPFDYQRRIMSVVVINNVLSFMGFVGGVPV